MVMVIIAQDYQSQDISSPLQLHIRITLAFFFFSNQCPDVILNDSDPVVLGGTQGISTFFRALWVTLMTPVADT